MTLSPHPKIAVIGAGAVGSLIGGLLARAGEDVTLVARPAHAEAIRAKGLRIAGVLGELTVAVRAAENLGFRPDVALMAVKTQDVESACRPVSAALQDAAVVTLQNGVRSDEIIASLLPKENIVSGVVLLNAQFLKPGEIIYARGGRLIIGEAFGPNGPRTEQIRTLLGLAIRTETSADIRGAHWTKLLMNNVANGLEAITGLSVRECLSDPGLRRIAALTLKEGYRAVRKSGIRLAPLPGVPLASLNIIALSPVFAAAWMLGRSVGSLKTLGSTLQSLRRGRPTEIDYLNGEIVSLGRKAGMATPYNAGVVTLVREVEKSRRFFTPAELVSRLASP